MKYLFGKTVVFFLVFARSRCTPGRLGTIDRFIPDFSVTDDDDKLYKVTSDETEDHTLSYYEDDDVTDTTTNKIPLESLAAHIDQLAGQGNTKGQFVYTDKTGNSITVVYVAGPSSSFAAAHTAV
ncbi:PREDICTED: uncharacterized protein LOC107162407 [Diuraphis noxia]|uniref:uncharacterized protein LOC107162407 n=1 Tax=Diuraphis noxia TaxID=143948 RepID=UPI000763694D|nr:PREDICTED: uncharacterized protein LOC107162407 [Diuraphis noxia]